jgi:hypothetical protein
MSSRAQSDIVPTDYELGRMPQLATLAILERTLEVTRAVLLAAHPELHACLDEPPHRLPWDDQAYSAAAILEIAGKLQLLLDTYRRTLAPADAAEYSGDDIPF